jgi:hypothetical protein
MLIGALSALLQELDRLRQGSISRALSAPHYGHVSRVRRTGHRHPHARASRGPDLTYPPLTKQSMHLDKRGTFGPSDANPSGPVLRQRRVFAALALNTRIARRPGMRSSARC